MGLGKSSAPRKDYKLIIILLCLTVLLGGLRITSVDEEGNIQFDINKNENVNTYSKNNGKDSFSNPYDIKINNNNNGQGHTKQKCRNLFLAGAHSSGTSLLHYLLMNHPDISGFKDTGVPQDEGQHLQSVYLPALAFGGRLMCLNKDCSMDETSALVTEPNKEKLSSEWGKYWNLTKPVLMEKSPPNVVRSRFLQAMFPSSCFVFIRRHPVATSMHQKQLSKIQQLFTNWLQCYQNAEKDKDHLKRMLQIRFEDLVNNPQAVLDDIFKMVGLRRIQVPIFIHHSSNSSDHGKFFGVDDVEAARENLRKCKNELLFQEQTVGMRGCFGDEFTEIDLDQVVEPLIEWENMQAMLPSDKIKEFEELFEKQVNYFGYSLIEPRKGLPLAH